MKIYADSAEEPLVIPSGERFPNNPKYGQLFKLVKDMPVTATVDRWYGAGDYIYDYGLWRRINDSGRQRKAVEIAPQIVSIEELPFKPKDAPVFVQGTALASLTMAPINRGSTYAGFASLWLEPEMDCQVALTLFRDNQKLISMTVEAVQKGRPRSMSLSFFDMPFTGVREPRILQVSYTLKINTDAIGAINVNRGNRTFLYDDVAPSSAFIVNENT